MHTKTEGRPLSKILTPWLMLKPWRYIQITTINDALICKLKGTQGRVTQITYHQCGQGFIKEMKRLNKQVLILMQIARLPNAFTKDIIRMCGFKSPAVWASPVFSYLCGAVTDVPLIIWHTQTTGTWLGWARIVRQVDELTVRAREFWWTAAVKTWGINVKKICIFYFWQSNGQDNNDFSV